MKQIVFLLLAVLSSSFCKIQPGVSVVFQNNSGMDLSSFYVSIYPKEFTFLNLKKGQRTDIVTVPKCYRYCFARAITTAGDTLVCQPEDFVGEKLYSSGKILMIIKSYPQKGDEKNIDVSGKWDADNFISTDF